MNMTAVFPSLLLLLQLLTAAPPKPPVQAIGSSVVILDGVVSTEGRLTNVHVLQGMTPFVQPSLEAIQGVVIRFGTGTEVHERHISLPRAHCPAGSTVRVCCSQSVLRGTDVHRRSGLSDQFDRRRLCDYAGSDQCTRAWLRVWTPSGGNHPSPKRLCRRSAAGVSPATDRRRQLS